MSIREARADHSASSRSRTPSPAVATSVDGSRSRGKTYRRYAEVTSCARVTTPLYRFTTIAPAAAARQVNNTPSRPARRDRTKHVTSGLGTAA
jgi:hypothetical protein